MLLRDERMKSSVLAAAVDDKPTNQYDRKLCRFKRSKRVDSPVKMPTAIHISGSNIGSSTKKSSWFSLFHATTNDTTVTTTISKSPIVASNYSKRISNSQQLLLYIYIYIYIPLSASTHHVHPSVDYHHLLLCICISVWAMGSGSCSGRTHPRSPPTAAAEDWPYWRA